MLTIREAESADFQELVTLWTEQHPGSVMSVAKLARLIITPSEYLRPGGVVAEQTARIIGFGTYRWSQNRTDLPPKFWIGHLITAANQVCIQERLCLALEQKAAAVGQSAIYAVVREDNLERVGLYQRSGYCEQMRSFGARLAVQQFDIDGYRGYEKKLSQLGVEIKTLRELELDVADHPALYRALFDVY